MMRDADVIIVGGGIIGCSLAWQLSKLGQRVLILERKDIASGADSRVADTKFDSDDKSSLLIKCRRAHTVSKGLLFILSLIYFTEGCWRK